MGVRSEEDGLWQSRHISVIFFLVLALLVPRTKGPALQADEGDCKPAPAPIATGHHISTLVATKLFAWETATEVLQQVQSNQGISIPILDQS